MQDRVWFDSAADWALHQGGGQSAVSAELCPCQPLLRVGGNKQQTRLCQAPQEPDGQNQSEECTQKGVGLNLGLTDCSW